MIERYAVLAARIRQELASVEHVVQNVYAFEFDPMRIEHLIQRLRPAMQQVMLELGAFADFLDKLAQEEQ